MVLGVGKKFQIRLKFENFDPCYGVKEYLLVQERVMLYCRVAAAIWENGIYDIENTAHSHIDPKILGHRCSILGHFVKF